MAMTGSTCLTERLRLNAVYKDYNGTGDISSIAKPEWAVADITAFRQRVFANWRAKSASGARSLLGGFAASAAASCQRRTNRAYSDAASVNGYLSGRPGTNNANRLRAVAWRATLPLALREPTGKLTPR